MGSRLNLSLSRNMLPQSNFPPLRLCKAVEMKAWTFTPEGSHQKVAEMLAS